MNIESRILIIAPYEKMAKIYKKKLEELGMNIQVEFADNMNYGSNEAYGVERLNELIDEDKEIVLTRGILARTIKRNFNVNVIETNVSGYDVLRTMYKYRSYNGTVAAVECNLFTDKVREIGELLGLKVNVYNVNALDDYDKCLKKAAEDGVELIFGGAYGLYNRTIIDRNNINYEMIESSENYISESLIKAIESSKTIFQEKRKSEMMKTILDFATGGIVAIDKNGTTTAFNRKAEKIFNLSEQDVLGRPIDEIIPQLNLFEVIKSSKILIEEVSRINSMEIVINRIPMLVEDEIVGALATFQKVKDIQEVEKNVRLKLSDRGLTAKYTFGDIKGSNERMIKSIEMAKAFCRMDSTILITGETGTGKELFAQSIHNGSHRKENPFVAINCSALPSNLLESELFGYVEGAFTGARKGGKQGIFEIAHKGTIFLDEIGDIDKKLQARLLRVLQEKEIMRIGDDRVIPIDVRVITATNKDLYTEVVNGNFRSDLYYRLNILNIIIPPLRERKDDLRELMQSILHDLNKDLRIKVTGMDNRTFEALTNYDWPGNIRELKNVLEKMAVLTQYGRITYQSIQYTIEELEYKVDVDDDDDIYSLTLDEIEKKVIERVLREENYNKKRTAERLGIGRSTLFRKLDKI